MIDLNLVFELALLVVLCFAMYRAARLERALSILRQEQASLGVSIIGVDQSTQSANDAMNSMAVRSISIAEQVAARIEVGQKICDDLAYLTDRAEVLADKLEKTIRVSRSLSA